MSNGCLDLVQALLVGDLSNLRNATEKKNTHSQVAQWQRISLPMQWYQKMKIQSLGQGDPLEEEMATHSKILAWRISWTEEPGGLQSTGCQRVTQLSTHVLEKQQQGQLKEDRSVFDLVHTYNVFKNKELHYNFLTK